MQSDQGGVVGELPLLSVLFAEHRTSIDAIKQRPECAPLLQPEHDDLFILRYVLSFKGDLQKCATAIKNAIEWRRANQNILARIDELQEEVRKIIPTGMLPWQTNQGQPIQVAIPFAVEASTWSTKSEQWHHEAGISNREVAYRICDKLSRESGRLVKLVMIQDLTGLSMAFVMQNSRLAQNQGKLSKLAEFLFPQLIATVVVTHPPSFIQTVYKMAGAVLSERLVKKVKMAENPEKICLFSGLSIDKVPNFLGGTYAWDAEWVPAKVRLHKNSLTTKQPSQRELHKATAATASPQPSRTFNPFGTSK